MCPGILLVSYPAPPTHPRKRERERGSGESCTSSLSLFRNFQAPIRLQYVAHDNSRTYGIWLILCARNVSNVQSCNAPRIDQKHSIVRVMHSAGIRRMCTITYTLSLSVRRPTRIGFSTPHGPLFLYLFLVKVVTVICTHHRSWTVSVLTYLAPCYIPMVGQ
jgi:hypothetical protein